MTPCRHMRGITINNVQPGPTDTDMNPASGEFAKEARKYIWPRPVRPGDELRVESEVLEVRPSKSRPDQGLIKVRTTTLNQHDEAVQISVGTLVVPRRASFFGHRSRKAAVTSGMGKYGA